MDANMRLDADKIELAKAILSITSKDVLDKVKSRLTDILDFHEKEEQLTPYTLEELHARMDHSIAELDAGKGIPSSEVFHKMEQKYPWLCK